MAIHTTANTMYLSRTTNLLDYNSPYTLMFWLNINALTAAIQEPYQFYASNSDSDGIRLNASNQWVLRTAIGGVNQTTGNTVAVAEVWQHVAIVRESVSVIKMYLNGALLINHTLQDITGRTAATNLRLGRGNTAGSFMAAKYAHWKMYPFALTEAQVRTDMYDLEPQFTPIHHWSPIWPVARAKDFSANRYDWTENGTLTDTDGPPLSRSRGVWLLPFATSVNAYTLTADQASFTLTGQSANLLYGHKLAAVQASFTVTGQSANLLRGYPLTAAQGTFTLSGQSATLRADLLLVAAQASYTLSGQTANLLRGYPLTASHGTFTLTGQTANLLFGHKMTAVQASYALAGNAAGLYRGYPLVASHGVFTLTGQAANLLATRLLTATQASYSLSGQAANLLFGRRLSASHGAFVLTGQDANLVYDQLGNFTLTASTGTFTLSGQAANLLTARLLSAAQASYTLTGQVANLRFGYVLSANQASYTLTGQSVVLLVARYLLMAQGSFGLTGQAATLEYSGAGSSVLIIEAFRGMYRGMFKRMR